MRVALVVTGGVDRSGRDRVIPALLWLVERLARRHQLTVYVLRYHDHPCTYSLLGATVHDLGRPHGAWAQHQALTRALRRDGPFAVVHAYWALPAGLAAGTAARRLRLPFLLTLDSGELVWLPDIHYGLGGRATQRLAVRATIALADRVTVCTHYMARLAQARGLSPDLVPLGVDRAQFVPGVRSPGPPWRVLHVASLNPVKDQHTLLTAFRDVLAAIPACHLDIVGEDTMDGQVERLARELGIRDQVTFHGPVPTDALVPLYQRAHLFMLSSRHEAANVATLEAAACGVPAVGTRVGYLADWSHVPTVEPGDATALAAAAVGLLRDPARAAAVAERSRAWTLAHDADWTAAQFERVYAEVAGRASR